MTHSKTFALLKISLKAKVWDEQPFILHEQIASGEHPTLGKFRIIRDVSTGTIFVELAGQWHEVSLRQIMDALIDAKENKPA